MKKYSTSLLAVLFICTLAAVAATAQKRMTIEDSLAVKLIGAPQFSPDSRRILYTVSEWDRKENRRVSHIYLISAEGGKSIRLTNGERGETAPQWSPDSELIAFIADRSSNGSNGSSGAQIWVISSDGGEAEKLTSEENVIQSFRWSPDGKQIAFVTRDAPKDKEARDKRRKERFDTVTVDNDYSYLHLWTINTETKEKKRLTNGAFSVQSAQWSPDSKWIVYVASKSGVQESSFIDISNDSETDIFVIGASGGEPRRLTTKPAQRATPQWSPDGKWIAYVAGTNLWATKSDIVLIPTEGGAERNLTAEFPESVGSAIDWSADGRAIYFGSGTGLYGHIYSVSTSGGKATQITKENRVYDQFDLSPNGKLVAYTVNDSRTPSDIWVAASNGTEAHKITWINPHLKDFAVAETEVIKWKGPDNFDIEGLLMKPIGYEAGKRYPLILQIHGGPYGRFSDSFNSRNQIWAANGYAVLMANPRGSTGYGLKFTQANIGDWGGKDFQDIMAGVDAVIAKGIADPDKLVVMGGSYGGFMTFWTITQTDRFKAAIGHAAISDWYSFHGQSDVPGLMEYGFKGQPWEVPETYRRWSPMSYVSKVKTPLMITHGERDFRVNIQQGEQFYRSLKKRGVEVVFYRYPREGHGIQEPNHVIDLTQRQLEWFDSHLGIKREKPAEVKAESASTR